MSLWEKLTSGEEVLARVGPFYATTHRVVRYEQGPDGKEVLTELPYNRLRSVESVRPGDHRMMAGGTALVLLGLFLGVYIGLYTPLLAVPLGLGLIFFGAKGKEVYYQLHGADPTPKDQTTWRIPYRGSMEFLAVVGDRSGRRPEE